MNTTKMNLIRIEGSPPKWRAHEKKNLYNILPQFLPFIYNVLRVPSTYANTRNVDMTYSLSCSSGFIPYRHHAFTSHDPPHLLALSLILLQCSFFDIYSFLSCHTPAVATRPPPFHVLLCTAMWSLLSVWHLLLPVLLSRDVTKKICT